MSVNQVCCLCCTTCSEYKSLQTDLDEFNEIYDITVKYFDPMLLTQDESTNSHHNPVLCRDCWFNINEFHEFQQKVLETRTPWEDKSTLTTSITEVKHEDVIQANVPTSNTADKDILDKSKDTEDNLIDYNLEYGDLKSESSSSCEDTFKSILKQTYEKDEENSLDLEEDTDNDAHNSITKRKLRQRTENINKDAKPSERIKKPIFNMERIRESDAIIAKWKSELICDLCSESTTNFANLRSHFRETHTTGFYIKCCERKFYHRWILVEHIQLHLNPDTFKCDICGKSCKTKRLLGLHKNVVHQGLNKSERIRQSDALIAEWKAELTCDVCSETATNFANLRSHFKEKHTTEFYIKCCERKFYQRRFLVGHIQLHINPETYKCDVCGKSSTTKQNLKVHKKAMHEGTDQVKCNICEKLFNWKSTLRRHMRTHSTTSKDFICRQCGETIHGKHALKNHLMDHAGIERPKFPCDVCGIELMSANSLKHHKSAYHNADSTIYVCSVCGKVAKSEIALRRHKYGVHATEGKHKCTYCDKAFTRPLTLREHIARHTGEDLYKCPNCPQTFKVKSNMRIHCKRRHPVEYEESRKRRPQYPKINDNQVKKHIAIL